MSTKNPHSDLIPCVVRPGQLWRAEKNYAAGERIAVTQATIDQHAWVFEKLSDREQRLRTTRTTLLTMSAERARACGLESGIGGIERYEVVRLDPGVPRREEIERELESSKSTAAGIPVSVRLLDLPEFIKWKESAEKEIASIREDQEELQRISREAEAAADALNVALGSEESPLRLADVATQACRELVRLRAELARRAAEPPKMEQADAPKPDPGAPAVPAPIAPAVPAAPAGHAAHTEKSRLPKKG